MMLYICTLKKAIQLVGFTPICQSMLQMRAVSISAIKLLMKLDSLFAGRKGPDAPIIEADYFSNALTITSATSLTCTHVMGESWKTVASDLPVATS